MFLADFPGRTVGRLAPQDLLLGLLLALSSDLMAQGASAPQAAASSAIPDHVLRAAERPYYWIRVNSQTPPGANTATSPPKTGKAATAPARTLPGGKPAVNAVAPGPAAPASAPTAALAPPLATSGREDLEPTPDAEAQLEALPRERYAPRPDPVAALSEALLPVPAAGPNEWVAAPAQLTLVQEVEPDFPAALQRRLRQGSVEVQFTVQSDGSVSKATVLRSSHPRLEAPALAAVSQWRFKPMATAKDGTAQLGFDLDR